MTSYETYLIHKPYGMLSQFSEDKRHPVLKDLDWVFSQDIYPIGRLDRDSEGLLLLSNDKSLNHQILHPQFAHEREYWVQVEGIPDPESLNQLSSGVNIKGYQTRPCKALLLPDLKLPARTPPIRERKNIPTSWLSLTLTEGKNRQVRRMTAAIGFPTLRLIRVRIENLGLDDLSPGAVRPVTQQEILVLLNCLHRRPI